MKIYFARNKRGIWKASLDKSAFTRCNEVFSCEVADIHNNRVFMIKTYYGFDYDLEIKHGGMIDSMKYSDKVYHSVSSAKKSETWKAAEKLAKENPNDYYVTPFSIASDDGTGSPFVFGDIMENKFNMQIFPIRVI